MDNTVLFCPHCGNTAPQTKLHTERCKSVMYGYDGKKDVWDAWNTVARCETCKELLIYFQMEDFDSETVYGDLAYPKPLNSPRDIPNNIRSVYNDAIRVKNVSPDAYVILARKP